MDQRTGSTTCTRGRGGAGGVLTVRAPFKRRRRRLPQITDILHFLSTGDEHWSLPSIGGDFPSSTSLLLTPPDHPSSPLGAVVPVDVGEDPMPVDGGSRVQAVGASPLAPSGVLAPSYSLGWETRPVQFVVSSERTGFRHLYLVTYTPAGGVTEMRPLTSGSWVVLDSAITVDPQRRLVYFMAKQDTPLGGLDGRASLTHRIWRRC